MDRNDKFGIYLLWGTSCPTKSLLLNSFLSSNIGMEQYGSLHNCKGIPIQHLVECWLQRTGGLHFPSAFILAALKGHSGVRLKSYLEDNSKILARNHIAKGIYMPDFFGMKENKDYKTLRAVFQVDTCHHLYEVKWLLRIKSSDVSLYL